MQKEKWLILFILFVFLWRVNILHVRATAYEEKQEVVTITYRYYDKDNTFVERQVSVDKGNPIEWWIPENTNQYDFVAWIVVNENQMETERYIAQGTIFLEDTVLVAIYKPKELPNRPIDQSVSQSFVEEEKEQAFLEKCKCTEDAMARMKSLKNKRKKKLVVVMIADDILEGYTKFELQYGTDRKFHKKKSKHISVSKGGTSVTLKNLKKGKTYYVRFRSYVEYKGIRYKSKWSKVKKRKIVK